MDNTRKTIKGISIQSILSVSIGIVELLSFSIMSRLLTKEDFGYYAAIMAIVTVFQSFSETGIGSAIIQKKDITTQYINNAFTLSLVFGLLISLTLFVSSGFLSESVADSSMRIPLKMMSVTLFFFCITSVNISIMYKRLQFMEVGVIQLIASIISTIVAVVMALLGLGYYSILIKFLLSTILIWLLTQYYVRTKYQLSLNKAIVKSIFGYSGWLMASVVFRNFAQQVDRLMMPKLLSVSLLGAYNRPKDFILQITGRINNIFDTVLFPVLSDIQDDMIKLQRAFYKSFYYLNIISTLLGLSFFFNGRLIIMIFFGDKWVYLTPIIQVFSIGVIFNVNGRLADCYLRSMALTKQQFYFRIFEALLKIISVFVGYRWGIIGIAITVVASDVFLKMFKLLYVTSKLGCQGKEVLREMLCSWKFLIVILPLCVFVGYLTPNTFLGDISKLIIFVFIVSFVFIVVPSVVGERFCIEIHSKLTNWFKRV